MDGEVAGNNPRAGERVFLHTLCLHSLSDSRLRLQAACWSELGVVRGQTQQGSLRDTIPFAPHYPGRKKGRGSRGSVSLVPFPLPAPTWSSADFSFAFKEDFFFFLKMFAFGD